MERSRATEFQLRHDVALAELERVRKARAAQLAAICESGLSADERSIVEQYVRNLQGPLGSAWAAYIAQTPERQLAALDAPTFENLPWQSLLQCNPYAMLARWAPIRLRAYA